LPLILIFIFDPSSDNFGRTPPSAFADDNPTAFFLRP
jgi:hypothetical protein